MSGGQFVSLQLAESLVGTTRQLIRGQEYSRGQYKNHQSAARPTSKQEHELQLAKDQIEAQQLQKRR
jgi:hypothetical protein